MSAPDPLRIPNVLPRGFSCPTIARGRVSGEGPARKSFHDQHCEQPAASLGQLGRTMGGIVRDPRQSRVNSVGAVRPTRRRSATAARESSLSALTKRRNAVTAPRETSYSGLSNVHLRLARCSKPWKDAVVCDVASSLVLARVAFTMTMSAEPVPTAFATVTPLSGRCKHRHAARRGTAATGVRLTASAVRQNA